MKTIEHIKNLSYEEQRSLVDHLYKTAPIKKWKLPERPTCLKAFVKTHEEESFSEKELRDFLKNSLPAHLIPSRIEKIDSFPITPNGKIDRKSLEINTPTVQPQTDKNNGKIDLEHANKVEKLTEIWKKALGRDHIGINDNFFDLGGHSLTAAQLITEVQVEYEVKLSIADLFKTPTVSEFSKLIENEPSKKKRKSLVVLNNGSTGKGIFCVHGYKGDAYAFLPIAKSFTSDRPIYGLQALGLDGNELFQTSFEEMAKLYVSEMFEVQAEGPYHLLGHSIGGWIAFAIAQEIKKRGEEVGSLGLLDTHVAPAMPWFYRLPHTLESTFKQNRRRIQAFKAIPGGKRSAYLRDRLKWLKVHLFGGEIPTSMREKFEKKSNQLKNRDYFAKIGDRYLPDIYHGDADLIICKGSRSYRTWFWKHLVKGKLRIHKTRGDHYKAIDEDHASDFAQLFENILQSIETEDKGA